jgi:hypothetical protein
MLSRDVRNRPKNYKERYPYKRRTIRVQCFPLYSILLALGNPTVDLFSLDIEGAELKVLETIPWSKVRYIFSFSKMERDSDIQYFPPKLINTYYDTGYNTLFHAATISSGRLFY